MVYTRNMLLRRICLAVLGCALTLGAADPPNRQPAGNVAPYYPTPIEVAKRMLAVGKLVPGKLHVDLGSGDGRLVILAAKNHGARSIGYELEPKLVQASRRQIEEMGLTHLAEIRQQDLFQADLSEVDLLTVYLLPRAMRRLEPILESDLKKGALVVSHDFEMPNWTPDDRIDCDQENEIDGLPHMLYVYQR